MKNPLLSLCLILGIICVFNDDSNAGKVSWGQYQKAYAECHAAMQSLEVAAGNLMARVTDFNDREKKKNTEVKQSGERAGWSKKEAKALAKNYKSRHLKFNKKIKEYQTDCKKVENMIKAGVIYGSD